MEKLYDLLSSCCPTVDFQNEKNLISDSLIDSIDLISIISDIEDEFNVNIDMENIVPENFNSVESMWRLINSLM